MDENEILAIVNLSDKRTVSVCRVPDGELAFVFLGKVDEEVVLRQGEAVALMMVIDGGLGIWRQGGTGVTYQFDEDGPMPRSPKTEE